MDSLKNRALIWLGEHTAYLPGGVNSGIIINENREALIIDSGLDASSGNKVLKALEQEKLVPIAVINTHAHADHVGGNRAILKKYPIPVYATEIEGAIMKNPMLEPFYLFGARPPKDMQSKFILSEGSPVDGFIQEDVETLRIKDFELEVLNFSGHSPGMIGIGYEKEALFLGDNLFPAATLEKYPVVYCYDVAKTLERLEDLKILLQKKKNGRDSEHYRYFVPAHGKPSELPLENTEALINGIRSVSDFVLEQLTEPLSRDELIGKLYLRYDIAKNMTQYYLTSGSVGAHLTYLMEKGLIKNRIEDGILKFYREKP